MWTCRIYCIDISFELILRITHNESKRLAKSCSDVRKRQGQTTVPDTSKLSSLSLSQISMDQSGPPVVVQDMNALLSTSTPAQACTSNQQSTDAVLEDAPHRQVLPSMPHQALYPSLATMGTSTNTTVSPEIPFCQRVIKDIEIVKECSFLTQLKVYKEQQIHPQHQMQAYPKPTHCWMKSYQRKLQEILFNQSL